LYAGSFIVLLATTALFDGGLFAGVYLGQTELTQEMAESPAFLSALWVAMALYLPVAAAFWHAPALVHWHGVSPVKSLFFSILACWKNKGALLVFGLGWLGMFALGGIAHQRGGVTGGWQRLGAWVGHASRDADGIDVLLVTLFHVPGQFCAGRAVGHARIRHLAGLPPAHALNSFQPQQEDTMSAHTLSGRDATEVLWFQRRQTLQAAAAWVAAGGWSAAAAQQRSNIVELEGDATLNGGGHPPRSHGADR
jgi:hypothetical protein